MSDSATKADFKRVEKKIDGAVEDLSQIISDFASIVDNRFNKIEEDIADLKRSHDRLVNTIDGFIGRIDKYETELAARDHKIDRLEKWIEQLAKKTNTKLTV
ncbi:MAG TPA: hypothetical protein PKB09_02000 [Candidatus Saccharibacteria bacterium]|nr:hypothetical protein [Candidatus Saccharibacteria bacterium]